MIPPRLSESIPAVTAPVRLPRLVPRRFGELFALYGTGVLGAGVALFLILGVVW